MRLKLPLAVAVTAATGLASISVCAEQKAESDIQFFVTERLWYANWDHRLADANITAPPTATSPPELTLGVRQKTSSKLVPITSFGLRYKDFLVSASGWSSSFDMGDVTTTGESRRREYDLTAGYSFAPGLTASLTYKAGKVNPSVTRQAASLLGLSGEQEGSGLLFGVSASGNLVGSTSLYGNFAYGYGQYQLAKDIPGNPKSKTRYTIGDFGVAYRMDPPKGAPGIDSITFQLGYRFQVLSFRELRLNIPSGAPVKLVSRDEGKPQTTTEGLVFGLGVAF